MDDSLDVGVEHGAALIAFARAVLGTSLPELDAARAALNECMGTEAATAAAITAAGFSLVDRAANGVGIWIEPMVLEPSAGFREAMGIDAFPSARNTHARMSAG